MFDDYPSTDQLLAAHILGLDGMGPEQLGQNPFYGSRPPMASSAAPPVGGAPTGMGSGEPMVAGMMPRRAPQAPTFDAAGRQRLLDDERQLRAPLDPRDPQFKPSFARVLAAAIAAGAQGFNRDVRGGIDTAERIIRQPYNIAEGQRQKQLGAAQESTRRFDEDFAIKEKEYDTKVKGFRAETEAEEAEARKKTAENQAGKTGFIKNGPDGEPLRTKDGRIRRFATTLNGKEYELEPEAITKGDKPGMSEDELREGVYKGDPKAVKAAGILHPRSDKSGEREERDRKKDEKDEAKETQRQREKHTAGLSKIKKDVQKMREGLKFFPSSKKGQEMKASREKEIEEYERSETEALNSTYPKAAGGGKAGGGGGGKGGAQYKVGDAVQYKGKTYYVKGIDEKTGKATLSETPVK